MAIFFEMWHISTMSIHNPTLRTPLPALLPLLPARSPGVTPAQLAAEHGLPRPSVTMALHRLWKANLIRRSALHRPGGRGHATHQYYVRPDLKRLVEVLRLLDGA